MASELSDPTVAILDGPGGAEIDHIDGPGTVDATIRIDIAWDYGTEKNDSQIATVELNEIGILATQVHDES